MIEFVTPTPVGTAIPAQTPVLLSKFYGGPPGSQGFEQFASGRLVNSLDIAQPNVEAIAIDPQHTGNAWRIPLRVGFTAYHHARSYQIAGISGASGGRYLFRLSFPSGHILHADCYITRCDPVENTDLFDLTLLTFALRDVSADKETPDGW